jgi:hypothetical protein
MPNTHVTISTRIAGVRCDIDERISADVVKINARGLTTSFSCQGDNADGSALGTAYITFSTITPQLDAVYATAQAAGFETSLTRGSIHANPGEHHDAVRDIATVAQHRLWNEKFRQFLHDIAEDSMDVSGARYRCTWTVHSCTKTDAGAWVDTPLLAAYQTWRRTGGSMSSFCHGDLEIAQDRALVGACIRWRAQPSIPSALAHALERIGFHVWDFGVFSRYKVRGSQGEALYQAMDLAPGAITAERLIAMNRTFRLIFDDYANGTLAEPRTYLKILEREQRNLRPAGRPA